MGLDKANAAGLQSYFFGSLVLFGAFAIILTALMFEHLGGYAPCPLCLQQRYAYYAGIPLAFAALVILSADDRRLAAMIFFVIALAFLFNAGLGVYQSGAEWGWWPGPDTCAGASGVVSDARDLLSSLETTTVVRCDQAAWRFAQLSFAGWNAVASLILSILALRAAFPAVGKN